MVGMRQTWYHCVPCSSLVGSDYPGLCKATCTPDRTIYGSYDWLRLDQCETVHMRSIGNVCYDLQQRSHTAINLYAWSRYHERLENRAITNDWRISMVKPQSHRIIRLLDRTIGCDLVNVRPIGHVCHDLQKLL